MTKILCIGLGGVGAMAAYTLKRNNGSEVEITAVIRSDYDKVVKEGYTISSADYGGRKEGEDSIKGFRPDHIFKSVDDVTSGPFDYIVISTKVVPSPVNVWDQIEANRTKLIKSNFETSIVLVQNGIDIESNWSHVKGVNLISGVSYISSTNNKGHITQYSHDTLVLGLFDINKIHDKQAIKSLEKLIDLYSNDINSTKLDHNARFTRWKKLIYNAAYNTVCCLTDLDVGKVYELKESKQIIEKVFQPLMKEVQYVANLDLKQFDYGEYQQYIVDDHITNMIKDTEKFDAPENYQPSMLVDSRNGRLIELEIILGNIIRIYNQIKGSEEEIKKDIPYLNFLYYLLLMVQHRLESK
ncbi:ketopantoate reductase PanE/ApbA C terminal-domain-containing protein [Scheffersomyces amazonensis]|uniref:ketopantoate reductase PanE/ApbA C terminal-domain-containing protein n=1 Tax=Scheffersomyces amazonensis TaxID=1078765 RepID=UPI00315D3D97